MKFFQCPDCGKILIPDRSEDFEPKKLVELIPNTTDAAGEKHVPVITVDGSCVRVAVGTVEHPMLEAHSITFIVLETSQGYQKKDLKPGEKPEAVFALAEGETVVAAYEYCNLHGLWKAEA
jgi:superoxide reductase